MYLKMFHLDPTKFISAPGLAWQATSKKTEVKLELLIDIDMISMVEKANNEYMKGYDENKESSYHKYWDVVGQCRKSFQ